MLGRIIPGGGDGKITDPSEKPVLFGLCIWIGVKATRPFSRLSGPGTTGDVQYVGTRDSAALPPHPPLPTVELEADAVGISLDNH